MESDKYFLKDLYVPVNRTTENDYMKIIETQQEKEKVINLLKQVFPNHWKQEQHKILPTHTSNNRTYTLGYFNNQNQLLSSVRVEEVYTYNIMIISTLQTNKSYRNNGIATSLFYVIKKIGRQRKFDFLYLIVRKNNKKAFNLYKKWNFESIAPIHPIEIIRYSLFNKKTKKTVNSQLTQLNKQHYSSLVNSFLLRNFPKYQKVFQQNTRMEKMICQERVSGLIINGKLKLLLTTSEENQQLDIYLPSKQSNTSEMLQLIFHVPSIQWNLYKRLVLLGELHQKHLTVLSKYGIQPKDNKLWTHLCFDLNKKT